MSHLIWIYALFQIKLFPSLAVLALKQKKKNTHTCILAPPSQKGKKRKIHCAVPYILNKRENVIIMTSSN